MSGVRFECPACERLVPVGAVRIDGAQVLLTCPRCEVVTRLATAADDRASASPPRPGAGSGSTSSGQSAGASPPRRSAGSGGAASGKSASASPPRPGAGTGGAGSGGSAGGTPRPPTRASGGSAATSLEDSSREGPASAGTDNVFSLSPRLADTGPGGAESPAPASQLAEVVPLRTGHPHPFQDASPFDVPAGHCTKCVAQKVEGLIACPQCGLLYDGFAPERVEPSPRLAQAWTETIERWREPEAHAVFLKQAAVMGELAEAGRLYRIAIARSPNDEAAHQARAEIVRMAIVPALPDRAVRTEDEQQKRKRILLIALLSGLCVLAAMAAAVLFG